MSTPIKVLIVDDSENLRKIAIRYLKTAGIEIEFFEAGNGAIAEEVLQEQMLIDAPIQVVFLDWMMPEVTGFEFLKKIRAIGMFKKSPQIIMLTAETYSDQINAALKFDVASYVTKPFSQEDIVIALTKAIEKGGYSNAA
jgi:DNA-binding response OmpR family regulator